MALAPVFRERTFACPLTAVRAAAAMHCICSTNRRMRNASGEMSLRAPLDTCMPALSRPKCPGPGASWAVFSVAEGLLSFLIVEMTPPLQLN